MPSILSSVHPGLDEDRLYVGQNIGKHVAKIQDGAVASLYFNKRTSKEGHRFLKNTDLYDTNGKRWIDLAESMTRDELRASIIKILTAILLNVGSKAQQKARHIVDTHNVSLRHSQAHDRQGNTVYSSPDVLITGEVRDNCSFERPNSGDTGYLNAVICIEILPIMELKGWKPKDIIAQLGVYARQIFICQPNRLYVRLLCVCENGLRFFHFDRAGVQYSGFLNFHENPEALIQLFLGLTGVQEQDIGFDTSIKFKFHDGKKIGGRIRTHDGRKLTSYALVSPRPLYDTLPLRGRGVVCWLVKDRRRDLVLKDSWEGFWEDPNMHSESELLRKAVGLTGVVQLVAAEDKRMDIQSFRLPCSQGQGLNLEVTFQWRIVTEAYGENISHFESEKQLIGAMRDAVAGHKSLVMEKQSALLHRDVSRGNILLGDSCAEPGQRGFLIDLDKAWNVHDIPTSKLASYGTGTRIHQSVSVLKSCYDEGHREVGWHDPLDDLESFFYVLMDVTLEKDLVLPYGEWPWVYERKDETQDVITLWSNQDEREAAKSKLELLRAKELDLDSIGLERIWSPAIRTLLQSFFQWVKKIVTLKLSHWQLDVDAATRKHFELCERQELEKYYAEVLALFDVALQGATEEPSPCTAPSTPERIPLSSTNLNVLGNMSPRKRSREEASHDTPAVKRGRKAEGVDGDKEEVYTKAKTSASQ